jgi:hypothetical protein
VAIHGDCGLKEAKLESDSPHWGGDNTFLLSCTEGVCCSSDVCVLTDEDTCALFAGEWRGLGTMCETEECIDFCPMDIGGDALIGVNEILWILDVWGPCP